MKVISRQPTVLLRECLSTDIGVEETSSTPVGYSLQLKGEGSFFEDFEWAEAASNTFGSVNNDQTFISPEPVVFVNELHYDNTGGDTGEGIEIAGTAGTDLTAYSIVLYNGSDQEADDTINLSGILPNQDNGYGTLEFFISGIQNGAPDGFALIKGEEVIQFLSYEGSFTAADGPAAGYTFYRYWGSRNKFYCYWLFSSIKRRRKSI